MLWQWWVSIPCTAPGDHIPSRCGITPGITPHNVQVQAGLDVGLLHVEQHGHDPWDRNGSWPLSSELYPPSSVSSSCITLPDIPLQYCNREKVRNRNQWSGTSLLVICTRRRVDRGEIYQPMPPIPRFPPAFPPLWLRRDWHCSSGAREVGKKSIFTDAQGDGLPGNIRGSLWFKPPQEIGQVRRSIGWNRLLLFILIFF